LPAFTIVCEGTSPLLMHNARLVDPLDEIVRQIRAVSSKTKKTDDDHRLVAELEWMGGIYYLPDIGPYVPATNLQKCLIEAARLSRGGKKIERGVLITTMAIAIKHDGPAELTKLYADKRFVHRAPVRVTNNRVMRTRPKFPQWTLSAAGMYDTTVINLADLTSAAEIAGTMIGLGDGRPTYGRFTCKLEAEE